MNDKIKFVFDKTIDFVFGCVLFFIIIAILVGVAQLFFSVGKLLEFNGITGNYIDFISDILTIYVLVELSRSLTEYFKSSKLRLSCIMDAAIVFTVRELLIGLFKHEIKPDMLYALAVLLFVLGALRIGSILIHSKEKAMNFDDN